MWEVPKTLKALSGQKQPDAALAIAVPCTGGWVEASSGSFPSEYPSYWESAFFRERNLAKLHCERADACLLITVPFRNTNAGGRR